MTSPPRTITVPGDQRPPTLDHPDPITGLRELGGRWEARLLAQQSTFSIGSSASCDLVLSSPYVSSLHCVLERRGYRVRVHDQQSRNGVFFGGRRETSFDLGAGDCFTVAMTTLLAMSDEMQLARPEIAKRLGYDLDGVVDETLVEAMRGPHLLVIGEKGSGQQGLVKAIHQASIRRAFALVHAPEVPTVRDIASARRGTLSFPVTGDVVDRDLVAAMLSPEAQVRVVVLAPSLDATVRALGVDAMSRLHKIVVRPLHERGGDLDHLIDRFFVDQRASLRMADLTPHNQAALRAYAWPENLEELRKVVDLIAVLAREESIRKAAEALGTPRSTLRYKVDAIDLTLPILTTGKPPPVDDER